MPSLPLLTQALDEAVLRQYHTSKDRWGQAVAAVQSQQAVVQANPFFQVTPETLQGWVASVETYRGIRARESMNASQKGDLVVKLGQISTENGKLKILDQFYAKLLDSLTTDFLAKQEDALTKAYVFIYEREKQVRLTMEEFRGQKQVKIRLVVNVDGVDYEEDTDDEGFSAQTTLGTLLLAHFLIAANHPRIIFFDETLSSHADGPLARFMSLIEQLRDDFGFKFLAVSHDRHRLMPYADRAYYVQDGNYKPLALENSVD